MLGNIVWYILYLKGQNAGGEISSKNFALVKKIQVHPDGLI